MARQKQKENQLKRQQIKSQNESIQYANSRQSDSNFFRNMSYSVLGFIVLLWAFQFQNNQEYVSAEQRNNARPDITDSHRDVFKNTKEVLNDFVDPDFQDKEITQKIVEYFHKWIHVELHPQIHYDTGKQLNTGHLGLKNDKQYCKKSDIWKLEHPESIYENYYILSDFAPNELPREITRDFGVDVMPNIYMGMNPQINSKRLYDISPKTTLLNSRISRFHHFHLFGKCMFCVFQTANHIPGKWSITGKDLVINNLRNYEKSNFVDPEECKKTMTFMPPSYRLYDKQECQSFFKHLESEEYKNVIKNYGIGFILKAGRDIHRGEGIELVTPEKQQQLIKTYGNGQKCGKVKETLQAQTYIPNPMLYKKRKIEVRIYFLIASVNPLIVYSQNMAHLRMCGEDFDLFSKKKEVHVCNVAVARAGEPNFVVDFSLDGLRDYLIEEGIISNPNWVEEEVYPQIYRAITHITRLGAHDFLIDSRVNENFALDFLLDDNSKIWFMENNPNPQIYRISDKRVLRHYKMFGDMFEIQFNYLRSRFQRLQKVARELKYAIKEGKVDENYFKNLFQKANSNRLEPEFKLHPDNSYHKVYDETLEGADKFQGYLPEACLYKN